VVFEDCASVKKALSMNGETFEGRVLIVDYETENKKAGYKPNMDE
jgi:hypothetical protein